MEQRPPPFAPPPIRPASDLPPMAADVVPDLKPLARPFLPSSPFMSICSRDETTSAAICAAADSTGERPAAHGGGRCSRSQASRPTFLAQQPVHVDMFA